MYEGYYKLSAKPFQLSPDPRFFFNSSGHKRALAYLRYGVKQGEGFIIVTGDVGTGKSTLVGALFKSIERDNVVAAQVVTTQLEEDDLLRMVAAAFGLPYDGVTKAALLHSLESYFRSCVAEGKRVLLAVDEAQNLPRRAIEELRMLSNFQWGGRALLQSYLLGQKEFRVTMRSEGFEQLRQRVIAAYHLRPLGLDETRGYIEHRLKVAGWTGDPAITDDAFAGIHHFTEGVPRRINTLCDRLLLYGYLEDLHTIDKTALESVGSDIVEEQGGAITGYGPVEAPQASEEVSKASADTASRRAASGMRERSGVVLPIAGSTETHGVPRRGNGSGSTELAKHSDESRITAVEQSVSALTDAMRKELALLRNALRQNPRPGKNGDD